MRSEMLLLRFCGRRKIAQRDLASGRHPASKTWNPRSSVSPTWSAMLSLTVSVGLTFLLTSLLSWHIPECISNFIKHRGKDTQQLYIIKIAYLGKQVHLFSNKEEITSLFWDIKIICACKKYGTIHKRQMKNHHHWKLLHRSICIICFLAFLST